MNETPDDLKYTTSHEWARIEADGLVRAGITDFAQMQLGDVVYLELPEPGRKVGALKPCAVVESVKAASDINSPISGEIVEVNEAVKEAPELVNQDAYANWLFAVRPANPKELDQLLDAAAYLSLTETS